MGGGQLDSGSKPTLVQRGAFKDLWTMLSTMYNIYFEWHSTTLRWWWSTLKFEHSNIQTCNWVVLKYSIHQSTFVYQVRNQRHVEVLFQFDRFSLLNFPIEKKNKKSQNSNLKHRRSSLDPLNLLLASWKKKKKFELFRHNEREMWAMRLLRKSALCCESFVLFCAARISFFARIKSNRSTVFFFVSACYSS